MQEDAVYVAAAPIAVLQGAETAAIQHCLGAFAASRRRTLRVVGVLEIFETGAGGAYAAKSRCLRSIADGVEFQLFQELGRDASSCSLLSEGVVQAGEAVSRQIARGCDLVVLSKFGKLEAENGSGLMSAFVAAIEAGVPVLSSVAPRYDEKWKAFASPFYDVLPIDPVRIDAWWASVSPE